MSGRRKAVAPQEALPLLDLAWTPKRIERAYDKAVRVARTEDILSAVDDGAITLGRALARMADICEARRDPWAMAATARELRSLLERLRLDPAARGAGATDSLAEFLAALQGADHDGS